MDVHVSLHLPQHVLHNVEHSLVLYSACTQGFSQLAGILLPLPHSL